MTRNYKRKFLFSLIITSIIVFFLLQAIFGENGIRKTEYVRNQIIQKEEILKIKDRVIRELEEKVDKVESTQHIVNVMNNIGYAPSGQSSYIFPYEQQIIHQSEETAPQKKELFILSPFLILIISISLSFLLNFLLFISKDKKQRKKIKGKTIEDSDDTYTIF